MKRITDIDNDVCAVYPFASKFAQVLEQEVTEVNRCCSLLLVPAVFLLVFPFLLHADSPPDNTIPVIGWTHGYEDIDTELYCRLSWRFFDGLAVEYFHANDIFEHVVLPADTAGMYTIINTWTSPC